MAGRAYAQIRWQQEQLGLLLVNDRNERFFLFAEKLLELDARRGEPLVVKLRNRRPGSAVGYYGGQVVGKLEQEGQTSRVTLYIGDPYQDLRLNAKGQPTGWIKSLEFGVPNSEMETFVQALTIMVAQQNKVVSALRSAEATPLSDFQE